MDFAAEEVRLAILRGELAAGEWLKQDELAERFGISPTPVREALRRLEAEGLVVHVARQGVKVGSFYIENAREYFELRSLLEPYAARRSARMITAEGIEHLRRLSDDAKASLASEDHLTLSEANWSFLRAVVGFSNSPLLRDVLLRVWRSFPLDSLVLLPERAEATFVEHLEILRALERKDPRGASSAMKAHITNVRNAVLSRLESTHVAASARAR